MRSVGAIGGGERRTVASMHRVKGCCLLPRTRWVRAIFFFAPRVARNLRGSLDIFCTHAFRQRPPPPLFSKFLFCKSFRRGVPTCAFAFPSPLRGIYSAVLSKASGAGRATRDSLEWVLEVGWTAQLVSCPPRARARGLNWKLSRRDEERCHRLSPKAQAPSQHRRRAIVSRFFG